MTEKYLIYDVGSTFTKLSAFAAGAAGLDYRGRAQAPTTLEDIVRGLDQCRAGLPKAEEFTGAAILSSSSAAGGLRMVAMGYMPRVTAKAAKEVAMNAGARVLEVVSHEEPADYRLEVLLEIRPDIILLAGGTDSGETESSVENARLIAKAGRNSRNFTAKVVVACNIAAQPEVAQALEEAGVQFTRVGNVMPTIHELNVRPARSAIHAEFIRQITNAPGLARLADLVEDNEVIPTPAAILLGAELLAGGTHKQDGVGGVLVLDVGGATTDVHSVIPALADLRLEERGLVINNDKQVTFRTVEGNLGLRVSATGIVEAVGAAGVLAFRERLAGRDGGQASDEECARLEEYAGFLEANTGHLPANEWEEALEPALAGAALEVALRRHAGHWLTEYNPVLGIQPGAPVGRDLRSIRWVVGVGGFFSHRPEEEGLRVLRTIFANPGLSLFPETPVFRLDSQYLLYAVGLLGKKNPDLALEFAKRYFEMEMD